MVKLQSNISLKLLYYSVTISANVCRNVNCPIHYENIPIQYTEIFKVVKKWIIFSRKLLIFCLVQNIDCGYKLEQPKRGSSNKYPQSMFWIINKKNRYSPAYPSYAI